MHQVLIIPVDRLGTWGMLWLHLTVRLPLSKATRPKDILYYSQVIFLKELANELCHEK